MSVMIELKPIFPPRLDEIRRAFLSIEEGERDPSDVAIGELLGERDYLAAKLAITRRELADLQAFIIDRIK